MTNVCEIGVAIMFFLLTFTRFNWYFESLGFSINLFHLFLPLFVVILALTGRLKKLIDLGGIKKFFLAGLFALLLSDILSMAVAYNLSDAFLGVLYRALGYFVVWILISIFNRSTLKASLTGILGGGVIVSLYGIWQFVRYYLGLSPFFAFESLLQSRSLSVEGFMWEYDRMIFLRPSSTFFDPNNAAGYVSLCLVLVFGLLLWSWAKKSLGRVVGLFLTGVLLVAVFLMQVSRSAILGLLAGLGFVVAYCIPEKKLRPKVLGVGIFASMMFIGLYIAFPAPFAVVNQRFLSIRDEQAMAESSRMVFAKGAVDIFKDYPWTGVGVGNFEQYFINEVDTSHVMAQPHSAYLIFLSETGAVGFGANVCWLLFVVGISLFTASWLRRSKRDTDYVVLIALLGGYISIVIGNIFYGYYPASLWCWAYTGLILGYINMVFTDLVEKGIGKRPESVKILGVRVDNISMKSAIESIASMVQEKGFHLVVTPYSEFFVRAVRDKKFKTALNNAALSLPDGIFALWAAKYMTIPVSRNIIVRIVQSIAQYVFTGASLVFYPEYTRMVIRSRVSGSDLIYPLCKMAAAKGYSVYLLGGFDFGRGNSGVIAAEKLREKNPKLRIIGIYPGLREKESRAEALRLINNGKPDILLVCFAGGSGELWLYENRNNLKCKVAIGLGGTFDFVAGYAKEVNPMWARLGLVWLLRSFSKQAGGLPASVRRVYRVWNGMLKSSIMAMIHKIKYGNIKL
ncbi:MAG: WecB/TagA/CpsF family glycosyltransferase [Patescibacteria group bacterium]|nr:WecB/TagA/CpsF family glycosyltransferase [Patescibacteria group bacterium]